MARRGLLFTAAVALALLLGACNADQDPVVAPDDGAGATTTSGRAAQPTTTAPELRTIEVIVEDGAVVGGPRRESVGVGERVRLLVSADVEEEVHVHTYDIKVAVGPDGPVEITFTASIPGVHEIELEGSHKLLLTLEVR